MSLTFPIAYKDRLKVASDAMALSVIESVSLVSHEPYVLDENGLCKPADGLVDLTLNFKSA